MAVTRNVREKGASKVQHVGCETGRVDTADQLQVVWEAKPEDKGGQRYLMPQRSEALCMQWYVPDRTSDMRSEWLAVS